MTRALECRTEAERAAITKSRESKSAKVEIYLLTLNQSGHNFSGARADSKTVPTKTGGEKQISII